MKPARLLSRVAIGGVATAVATAGLVGVSSTSASAAPVSTLYTCSGAGSLPVSVNIALLPSTGTAGFPLPAGFLSFDSTVTVSGVQQGGLDSLPGGPVTGGKSTDFGTVIGSAVVPSSVTWTKPAAPDGSGNFVYTGKGSNAAVTLPQAGTYTIAMPSKFSLAATNASGATVITVTCASANPAPIGTITLSKQASTVKAKAPKSAKVGSVVTVTGKVKNEFSTSGGPAVTGKLIVKDGSKTVAKGKVGKKGKFKIKVKGLKVGSHKLKVIYKGDNFTSKSKSDPLKLTIKK